MTIEKKIFLYYQNLGWDDEALNFLVRVNYVDREKVDFERIYSGGTVSDSLLLSDL